MAWVKASADTPGAVQSWNGEGYDWFVDTGPAAAPTSWDQYWSTNTGGGGATRTVPQLAQKMGMSVDDYTKWVDSFYQRFPGQTDSNFSAAQFARDMGMSDAQAQAFGNESASNFSSWQGQQEELNKDHGMETFLPLLLAAVGGGAFLAGGFGAGVGANAAGAMGIEATAAGTGAGLGLGAGAGEGLVGWDALGNAASGGFGEVGSLAGTADMSAGWGVTQGASDAAGGGMDVWDLLGDPSMYGLDSGGLDSDLLALLDSPSGGGGSMSDWWSQAAGSGSNYSIADLANIAGLSSTSGVSEITDFLKGMGVDTSGLVGKAVNGLTGGLLGGSSNNLLGGMLGLAPILGGLAYGYNMAEPDLGRLESLYDQYNPQASLGLYDYNTEMGRNQLYSNLGRRGISGSSFANNDITNYNTIRDMGRGSTLNQGVSTAAGIANQIAALEAVGNRTKTDLIGRGLYSIGTLFGGK